MDFRSEESTTSLFEREDSVSRVWREIDELFLRGDNEMYKITKTMSRAKLDRVFSFTDEENQYSERVLEFLREMCNEKTIRITREANGNVWVKIIKDMSLAVTNIPEFLEALEKGDQFKSLTEVADATVSDAYRMYMEHYDGICEDFSIMTKTEMIKVLNVEDEAIFVQVLREFDDIQGEIFSLVKEMYNEMHVSGSVEGSLEENVIQMENTVELIREERTQSVETYYDYTENYYSDLSECGMTINESLYEQEEVYEDEMDMTIDNRTSRSSSSNGSNVFYYENEMNHEMISVVSDNASDQFVEDWEVNSDAHSVLSLSSEVSVPWLTTVEEAMEVSNECERLHAQEEMEYFERVNHDIYIADLVEHPEKIALGLLAIRESTFNIDLYIEQTFEEANSRLSIMREEIRDSLNNITNRLQAMQNILDEDISDIIQFEEVEPIDEHSIMTDLEEEHNDDHESVNTQWDIEDMSHIEMLMNDNSTDAGNVDHENMNNASPNELLFAENPHNTTYDLVDDFVEGSETNEDVYSDNDYVNYITIDSSDENDDIMWNTYGMENDEIYIRRKSLFNEYDENNVCFCDDCISLVSNGSVEEGSVTRISSCSILDSLFPT